MGKGPHVLPRRPPIKERSRSDTGPSFMDDEYAPIKQAMREATADWFSRYIHTTEPYIFCMPYYWALCAKTIHRRIPGATFRAVDKYSHVKENVAEIAGEKIKCYMMSVKRYIEQDPDQGLRFHGAFLDYFGGLTQDRINEIEAFVRKKMQPDGVLAVTSQCTTHDVHKLAIHLRTWSSTIELVFCEPYQTRSTMCHGIFLLDRGNNE